MITVHRINYLSLRHFCGVADKKKIYSKTVLLPRTKFPLRLESKKLVERDASLNNSQQFKDLYSWQEKRATAPEFILHDGPPYANGAPHMGHAVNKVLKDIIVRKKILDGYKVNYIPGWDCHGLPIELKALANVKDKLSPLEIRQKARGFASATIEKQKAAFQSWGVIGDWDNPYKTYNNSFVANQIRQFYELYKKKLVYRDWKPVYWSPSSRTALAEAELEYNDMHKSTSIFLKLKINNCPQLLKKYEPRLFAIIWTTTPWTLPSNQAICYNPSLSYSLVQKTSNSDVYLIASDLVQEMSKVLRSSLEVLTSFSGEILQECTYSSQFANATNLPFLPSSHATSTKGTGLVHTAPAHGPDDFLVALNHKIAMKCIVDESGSYTNDAGPDLKGLFVLKEGIEKVLEILKGDILHIEDFIHSYPYDWRTKKPVILRGSEQWFFNTNAIKDRCIELLEDVKIMPKGTSQQHKRNLIGQLKKRPYWCISRQRSWGVPIPVFYRKSSGETVVTQKIIDHLSKTTESKGIDFWWSTPLNVLLDKDILEKINVEDIERKNDILDIWFDSGLSWSGVLKGQQIADVYLEGLDQFTGWFQSSLLTSVALRDKAPYKNIYVHGFTVDENGSKMSKSLGNVVDPKEIIEGSKKRKPFGVDALRWWVASRASQDSLAYVSNNVLQDSADEVQKLRNAIRFILGALFDYKTDFSRSVHFDPPYENLSLLDKYLLHLLWDFKQQVAEFSRNYQFNKICTLVINLQTNPISGLYFTAIKDRLYCEEANSETRRNAQYILNQIFEVVMRSIAPIVPHLAEELYMHLPCKKEGSFFQNSTEVSTDNWENKNMEEIFNLILKIRRDVHVETNSNTLDKSVTVSLPVKALKTLQGVCRDVSTVAEELCDIFQVSEVRLLPNWELEEDYVLDIRKSENFQCGRCRRFKTMSENSLCDRCDSVIKRIYRGDMAITN